MALSHIVPNSITEAREVLKTSLINLPGSARKNYPLIERLLQKHPDLVNSVFQQEDLKSGSDLLTFENEQKMGYYGTPLLLACEEHGYDEGTFLIYYWCNKYTASTIIAEMLFCDIFCKVNVGRN